MTKKNERRKAIEMRKDGATIIEIADSLGVAKASAYMWTKDMKLPDDVWEKINYRRTHCSEETRKLLIKAKSGKNHPMYGKHPTEQAIKNMSNAQRGEKNSMYGRTGKDCPAWKGGISGENDMFRASFKYEEWRKSVFERDNYICQECGNRGGDLNAHHILPFCDNRDPEYSLSIDNGITLCIGCHDKTKGREYEFVERYQSIVNLSS